jgi:phosphatidylinositol kinase/protein kinase (PI-3  family)
VGAGTTEAAKRALLRLKQKLQGLEDPTSGEAMSVQGQVQLLLNEATDAENLCMLYHGWAPWL